MEKWKIAVIGALFLSLLGFGIYQQIIDTERVKNPIVKPVAATEPSPYLGKTLPPMAFKTWKGQPVKADLGGTPTLVEIFRIECPHCEQAAPLMVAIKNRYGPRGLNVVGIQSPGDLTNAQNPENKWGDVSAWLQKKKINYPIAFDQDSKYFQGSVKKQVLGGDSNKLLYPTIALTDKNGVIGFSQTGHDVAKAIALAVELEKRFPTSDDVEKNADSLTAWLKASEPELRLELESKPDMEKSLRDDIAERLKGKQ